MGLCSEYVEFGNTSTELEQFQQTPQGSTELVVQPQIPYHTNQFQPPLQQLTRSENSEEQSTHISSATEEKSPDSVNEPVAVTSQQTAKLTSKTQSLLETNLADENISLAQMENTVLSANLINQQQTEQNSTEEPSYLENLLEELTSEIEEDNEEETLNNNSASTSEMFPTFLEQIQQLETSLEELAQTNDPKQQVKQASGDAEACSRLYPQS